MGRPRNRSSRHAGLSVLAPPLRHAFCICADSGSRRESNIEIRKQPTYPTTAHTHTKMDEWWKAQPPVTKWFLAGAFGFTLAGNFGLISPVTMIFDLELVWRNFHIWRLFTCALFMGKLGFPFLINLFYFYKYSGELETNSFTGDTAGYVWFFTIIWGLLLTGAALMNNRLIGGSLTMAVIYLWANRNGDRTITFWFGIKFKAIYFPWALTVLTVLLGGSPVSRLIGIAVGH